MVLTNKKKLNTRKEDVEENEMSRKEDIHSGILWYRKMKRENAREERCIMTPVKENRKKIVHYW